MHEDIPDDTDELMTLTVEQAERLARREEKLSLNGLTTISDEAAEALAKHTGGSLCLDGLTILSETAAAALASHAEEVYLESLTELTSPALAAKLGAYFWFPNVRVISAAVAAAIVEACTDSDPKELCLDSLPTLTAETAQALARHEGYLSLSGLTSLPDDVAAALAEHQGSLNLEGVTELSEIAAAALARHRGSVCLRGLTSLSPETAKHLAAINCDLSFDVISTLSDEAAVALGRHTGRLSFFALEDLSPGAAEGLAANAGALDLRALKTLSAEVARNLAKHKDLLSLGLTSITDETARALAKHGGGLCLDSLPTLADATAQHLSQYRGWILSLDGVSALTAKAAAILARRKADYPRIAKLSLDGHKTLPHSVAEALARFQGYLYLGGVEELSDRAAGYLATHDGLLSMRGLASLSDLAAEKLGALTEIEVEETKWPESAAQRFRESRPTKGHKAARLPAPIVTDRAAVAKDEAAVRSTLVLRDVIAAAPSVLDPVGSYTLLYADDKPLSREQVLSDSDIPRRLRSDVHWAIGDYLASLPVPEAPAFASSVASPDDPDTTWIKITLPGCPPGIALDGVSADALRRLYDAAAPGAFGDMKAMETRVDPLVRSGREIGVDGFRVAPALCEWVRCTWAEHFQPEAVRVEPYKINLYAPGDRFAMHRDTPERNLVGTFLLALSGWGPPCSGGGLVVHDEVGSFHWDGAKGWAAFVPYLAHEVEPVACGARVTLAFKVFATGDMTGETHSEATEALLEEVADRIALCRNESGQVGVLLKYAYSLNGTALCGADRFIYRALTRLGTVESVPVAVRVQAEAKDSETVHWRARANVYTLTQGNLEKIASGANEPAKDDSACLLDTPFIAVSTGHVIHNDGHGAVDNVGNYAEPANIDSLYVHRALIVTKPTPAMNAAVRCPNADLARTDLSGRNLQMADFQGVSFRGASLARANLQRAFLANADLSHADLWRADLTEADLAHADLTNADVSGACLRDASLQETCLDDVQWDDATVWPDGFDPLQYGAAPMRETSERRSGDSAETGGQSGS